MSQGSGEKKQDIDLAEVVDAVERVVNVYGPAFVVSIVHDKLESADDPNNEHGMLTLKDEHRDGDIVQTHLLRWRIDEYDWIDVEFRVGEETWTALDELPMSMYFHVVDLYRDLKYKEAARLAAKE